MGQPKNGKLTRGTPGQPARAPSRRRRRAARGAVAVALVGALAGVAALGGGCAHREKPQKPSFKIIDEGDPNPMIVPNAGRAGERVIKVERGDVPPRATGQ